MPTLNLNLTQEQYNQLINCVKDNEQLKNLFNQNQENNILNEASIRTLSSNEYEKYIKNSSLNGSITIYNNNTWHYKPSTSYYVILGCQDSFQSDAINRLKNYNGQLGSYQNNNYIYITCPEQLNKTYYLSTYREIFSNNTNNIFYTSENNFIDIQILYYNPFESGLRNLGTSISNTCEKNTFPYKQFSARGSGEYRVKCNIYRYTAFRPLFQYKDNSKSSNIYM